MSKVIAILSLSCVILSGVNAQSDSLRFLFPIFFEDSLGNKDTVYIGGAEVENEFVSTESRFGEVNLIEEPFDSVFEVRGGYFEEMSGAGEVNYLGKKIILKYTSDTGDFTDCDELRISNVSFAVWSQHPPLKVSWDPALFRWDGALECMNGSIINNTFAPLILWWDDFLDLLEEDHYDYACLGEESGGFSFLPFNYQTGYPTDNVFWDIHLAKVEGSEMDKDTTYVYNLWWAGDRNSLCEEVVDVPELSLSLNDEVVIYPNPVDDVLHFSFKEPTAVVTDYEVYRVDGSLVLSGSNISNQSIDVSTLAAGTYLVRLIMGRGETIMKKVIRR